ncbi:MAG: metal-dependent transcriptional regulator, partial [Chloroflexota bacterium]|nr:metal-dependent transcriptional regulator [Chloroflexota bacterium]
MRDYTCDQDRPKLTAAMEDYLKAIYHLQDEGQAVSTVVLAERLGVAAPSVTNMVKRLQEIGLVLHSPYRGIELTPAGRAAAVEVVRHHRLIELYLSQFLDVPWERVHGEAERLEHVLSEELESRMAEKLGQPTVDPHGHPIPSSEGDVSEPPSLI